MFSTPEKKRIISQVMAKCEQMQFPPSLPILVGGTIYCSHVEHKLFMGHHAIPLRKKKPKNDL